MKNIINYFEGKHIKAYEAIWLLYVHILGTIGAIQFLFFRDQNFYAYLVLFIAWHVLSALGITGGSHRLWAHKSYKASLPVRVGLMLMNSNCFQGSIWHWSRDHRLHHKFSDTPLDPHNAARGMTFSHFGWLLQQKSKELIEEGLKLDMSDLKADPVVMFQKKHYFKLAILMGFVLPTLSGYLINGNAMMFNLFFLGFTKYIFTLNATWCVNSICHFWGTREWNKNIEPRDNFFVSLITNGEGWHNWHHEYPKDWRASKNDWWMFNPTCTFIQMCEYMGLADTKIQKIN